MVRVAAVGLASGRLVGLERHVANPYLTGLPVEIEEDHAGTVGLRFTDRMELDDEAFAGLDVEHALLALLQPVEEHRSGKHPDIGVAAARLGEAGELIRVQQVAETVRPLRLPPEQLSRRHYGRIDIGPGQALARPPVDRFVAAEQDLPDVRWPPAGRLT